MTTPDEAYVPPIVTPDCAKGDHPMAAAVLDGEGGISCSACGATGRAADATAHPHGEFCQRNGCHEAPPPTPRDVSSD